MLNEQQQVRPTPELANENWLFYDDFFNRIQHVETILQSCETDFCRNFLTKYLCTVSRSV